jgi:hypothetical protein
LIQTARLYSPSYLRDSTIKSSSSISTIQLVFSVLELITFSPILRHTYFPMCIQIIRSRKCFRASRTNKLAINSFYSMNHSGCIRNAHKSLTDITEVVFTFRFSIKHLITSSTLICGRHFYFGFLVRI